MAEPQFRVGRHRPNHVYLQLGARPGDDDREVAVAFTDAMGHLIAAALNAYDYDLTGATDDPGDPGERPTP